MHHKPTCSTGRISPHSAPTENPRPAVFYPLDSLAGSCNCFIWNCVGLQRVTLEKKCMQCEQQHVTPLRPEKSVSATLLFPVSKERAIFLPFLRQAITPKALLNHEHFKAWIYCAGAFFPLCLKVFCLLPLFSQNSSLEVVFYISF